MSSESESEMEQGFKEEPEDDESEDDSEAGEEEADSEYESAEQEENEEIDAEKSESESDENVTVSKKPIEKKPQKEKNTSIDQPKNWKSKLLERFEKQKGKTLFVLFPHVIPADIKALEKKMKNFCSRVIRVHLPKQKKPRHCLVDFDNPKDRAKGLEELSKVEIDGKTLQVKIPKTENPDYVSELIEKKAKKRSEQRARQRRKKAEKMANAENTAENVTTKTNNKKLNKANKTFTSTIIVKNIPSKSTAPEIKALFSAAVDVKVNAAKKGQDTLWATVTFRTPKEATKAKRNKYKVGGNDLILSFEKVKSIDQPNGQNVQQSPKSKGGKRRLDSTSESPSPKKKLKKNKNEGNVAQIKEKEIEEKAKNIVKIKKMKLKKKLNKEKGKKKEEGKNQDDFVIKKKTKNLQKNDNVRTQTVTKKIKNKKAKTGKQFQLKKPKVK